MTKLSKSISVAELMHLREVEGLSNGEIAEKIGCHINTVIKYIGKHPDGKRKKRKVRAKEPPKTLSDFEAMKYERAKSFKERLEESYKRPVPVGTVKIPETVREDIERKLENGVAIQQPIRIPAEEKPRTLADFAREAHERKMAEMNAVGTEDRTHIHELVAVFGAEAVTTWLKVSLYNMSIPYCRPMTRQKMLEMLKNMNAGGANA